MAKTESSPHTGIEVSAQKKLLLLGRQLGMARTDSYQPAKASVTERASHRQQILSNQYQLNLETIYKISLSHCSSEITGSNLDPDWSHQFFKLAEQIHNRTMQELWGRILAHELTNPGSFSLRTLTTLKQLTHKEALVLEKAASVAAKFNGEKRLKLLTGYRTSGGIGQIFRKSGPTTINLSHFGLPYSNILMLVDAGIMHKAEFETGVLEARQPITLFWADKKLSFSPKRDHLVFNYYRFTTVGDELCQLMHLTTDHHYCKAIGELFSKDFTSN